MTRYSAGFYFRANRSQVVLIEKKRPKWMAGRYNAVGGHVYADEGFDAAMSREFEEEAGVLVPCERWKLFAYLEGDDENRGGGRGPFKVAFYFTDAAPLDAKIRAMTDEVITIVDVKEVLVDRDLPVMPNLRWLLSMALGPTDDMPFRVFES